MKDNPIEERLSVKDTFNIEFHDVGSEIHNTTKEYKSRNNIEALISICNWLLESHEAMGTQHGYIRTKEEEIGDREFASVINKLNTIIALLSEGLTPRDETLVNVRINSVGIMPESSTSWKSAGTIEFYVTSTVRKKISVDVVKEETKDGAVWVMQNLSDDEADLIDKMVFLLHRNNHSHQK